MAYFRSVWPTYMQESASRRRYVTFRVSLKLSGIRGGGCTAAVSPIACIVSAVSGSL